MTPKRWQDSATETVQVVLPNDSNPLGFILGGTVMHLIDITGAIACHRHTNTLALTAGVDGLEFLHPIKVGDMIILKSRVTCTFRTSLEVEVEVFSEEIVTGAPAAHQPRLPHVRVDRPRGARAARAAAADGDARGRGTLPAGAHAARRPAGPQGPRLKRRHGPPMTHGYAD